MARVTGPSRKELDARGDEFAARVSRAIRTTLRDVAQRTHVVDDLARIQTVWHSVVKNSLTPHLRKQWDAAVLGVRMQLEEVNERDRATLLAAVFEIPKVSNPLAESFLADAQNRLTAIGDVVWYTARGEMLTGMQLGEGVAELRERVKASANVSQKRAEVIARTEVNSAMNNGAYEQMKALDVATIKEWIATDDSRTRESHAEVDGEEIAGDAKFMVGGYAMDHPHDLNAPPSETINCVIGSTQVDTPLIQMAMRSWLDGDVVEIRTSTGKTLTVTPNHPVLTTTGWLLASQLKVGDNVLCGDLTRKLAGSLHNEQRRPTEIAEVFNSASSLGVASDRECVANLHGEWREAKIRVVAEDRQLGLEVVPARSEEINKLSLTATYGTCACLSSTQGGALTLDAAGFILQDSVCATCGVGVLRETTSVMNSGRGVPSSIALGDSACLHFSVEQNVSNRATRNTERLANGDHRFTLDVSTDDVVSIIVRPYSGHVYNLSTTTGWYTGNSIITGNCRCTLAWEIIDDEDDYEDDLVADGTFHLPSKHNQETHGRRYKTPGDKSSGLRDAKTSGKKSAKPREISPKGQRVLDFIKDDTKQPLPASEANGHWYSAFDNPNFSPETTDKYENAIASEKAPDAMHAGYIPEDMAKAWLPIKKVDPASLVQTQKWLRQIDLSQSVSSEEGDRDPIIVYRAKDGTRYLTNGHHRINLALAKGIDEIEVREATSTIDVPSVVSPRRKDTPRNEALTAAGDFDEVEHPRDGKGRFAKKAGGSAPKLGKKVKITHGLVHKKHEPGTIIAVSGDDDKRVVWDGNKYLLQSKKESGGWETESTAIKSKAYVEIGKFGDDWHESSDDALTSNTSDAVNEPTPSAKPKTSKALKSGEPGSPLKITHGLVHSKYEPGDIIAENGAGDKRVVWDGAEYRLQRTKSDGSWTTEKSVKKSKAYAEINTYDSDWRSPGAGTPNGPKTSSNPSNTPTAPATAPASGPTKIKLVGPSKNPSSAPASEPKTGLGPPLKSMNDLTKIESHKKGGIFEDEKGLKWNVQPAQSESHARNQFLAANLYNFAGVAVESTDIVAVDSEKIPSSASGVGVKTLHDPSKTGVVSAMNSSAKARAQVNENFAIDAWLGNWDVVGLGYENLNVNKWGDVKRTNIGGSLLYRANGTPKGNAFGDTVTEIDSLRNPYVNPASAKVFADVTDDDIRKGVAKLEKLSPETIDFVVDQSGFTGDEATKLKKTLKARRQDLINKYGSNAPKPPTVSAPAPSTQPTATSALGGTKTYTLLQKAKVQGIFAKHNVKWFNKTNAIYDAAHEVSTTHPDLTMADALDIMDQSLKKKSDNPFRTKTEKWLKTKAGKQHALSKGSSASLGGTAPATSPAPVTPQSQSNANKYVDHGGALPQKLTRTTAGILQQRMDKETPPPWTASQKAALRKYTGGDYTTINKCARGTAPCSDATKKTLKDINAAMKPSTDDVVVYRKTNPKSFGVESGEDLKTLVGKTISDDGVISTSIRSNMWTGKLDIEIEAPKGSMLAWVQPISHHPGEDEIVVAPGTHYEIVEVIPPPNEYGAYKVKLRIIPGSDAQSRAQADKLKTQEAIAKLKAAKEVTE